MTQEPNCQCSLPEEMKAAGGAAALCHHSSPDLVRKAQEQVFALLTGFGQRIEVQDMFNKPLREVSEDYMKGIMGDGYGLRNREEHNILMIAFLRHMSVGMQGMIIQAILDLQADG